MRKICLWMLAAILSFSGVTMSQGQVMKNSDLEKYAKNRYGDKWLDAAANLASSTQLDKNESLTYQEVAMGPYYYDCPKGILDLLTPTDNECANDWRRKCREKKEKKSSLCRIPTKTA